jgi:hypothetical protein
MSETLNISFLDSGFLEISKQQNPQNMNKFKYLMNVWVTISINIVRLHTSNKWREMQFRNSDLQSAQQLGFY